MGLHLTGRKEDTAYRASVRFEQVERWSLEVEPDREDYQVHADRPEQAAH